MKKFLKLLKNVLSGKILEDPIVKRNYPFLLFIAVLAMLWIANTYSAFHIRHNIDKVEKKLDEAHETLKNQKVDYTRHSQPSKLIEKLKNDSDSIKIKMAHNATQKIVVSREE